MIRPRYRKCVVTATPSLFPQRRFLQLELCFISKNARVPPGVFLVFVTLSAKGPKDTCRHA